MTALSRTFAAAAAAALIAAAGFAAAQDAPPIPAAPGAASVENTPIGDLVDNPATHKVLEKDMPALLTYPGLDGIKTMTLRGISVYPEAQLDDAKLKALQADLNAAAPAKP
jgi:hypothetical protein